MVDDRDARLAAAEATLIKALSMSPQHARAHMFLGVRANRNETRGSRHSGMRAGVGAGSKFGRRPCSYRLGEGPYRSRRRRPRPISRTLFGSLPAILVPFGGCNGPASPSWFLALTPKRSHGYAEASKPTEIIPSLTSNSPPHWRCSAHWRRRGVQLGLGLRLTRLSPFAACEAE